MASRIPVQKIIESHEVRLRKLEAGTSNTNQQEKPNQERSTEPSMVDHEARREVQGMKRDMHEVARRIQGLGQHQQQIHDLKQTVSTLETYCHTLESKLSKMSDLLMATNTDLLRFREQIFENANIKLHIQEQQEQQEQQQEETVEEPDPAPHKEEPQEPEQPKERKQIDLNV